MTASTLKLQWPVDSMDRDGFSKGEIIVYEGIVLEMASDTELVCRNDRQFRLHLAGEYIDVATPEIIREKFVLEEACLYLKDLLDEGALQPLGTILAGSRLTRPSR